MAPYIEAVDSQSSTPFMVSKNVSLLLIKAALANKPIVINVSMPLFLSLTFGMCLLLKLVINNLYNFRFIHRI